MKRVEFRLTMPSVGSWNGKWSGEGRNYTIVKNIADKWAGELGLTDKTPTNSWHYHWDDGWTARITARIVPKGERLKKSDGFCGYDWMVENILLYGSPYGKEKEAV
jgi:hypothetical protein